MLLDLEIRPKTFADVQRGEFFMTRRASLYQMWCLKIWNSSNAPGEEDALLLKSSEDSDPPRVIAPEIYFPEVPCVEIIGATISSSGSLDSFSMGSAQLGDLIVKNTTSFIVCAVGTEKRSGRAYVDVKTGELHSDLPSGAGVVVPNWAITVGRADDIKKILVFARKRS